MNARSLIDSKFRWPLLGAALLLGAGTLAIAMTGPEAAKLPVPVAYERDQCAQCSMTIHQPGFVAEAMGADGKIQKFDDIGCLLKWLPRKGKMPEAWVQDHDSGGFVPITSATFVRGRAFSTPMGSRIVAFAMSTVAKAFAEKHAGEVVSLEVLLREIGPEEPTKAPVARAQP